jgi:uncharacterized protein (DUF2141 family)
VTIKKQIIYMKTLIATCIALIIFPLLAECQYKLTIEVSPLRNNTGEVLLELSNEKGERTGGFVSSIVEKKCIVIVENLNSGKYAFRYFHDENKNKKLDTNLIGMPKEGFGFSNNAKGKFGPPSFKQMIFKVDKDSMIICKPSYL